MRNELSSLQIWPWTFDRSHLMLTLLTRSSSVSWVRFSMRESVAESYSPFTAKSSSRLCGKNDHEKPFQGSIVCVKWYVSIHEVKFLLWKKGNWKSIFEWESLINFMNVRNILSLTCTSLISYTSIETFPSLPRFKADHWHRLHDRTVLVRVEYDAGVQRSTQTRPRFDGREIVTAVIFHWTKNLPGQKDPYLIYYQFVWTVFVYFLLPKLFEIPIK